MIDKKPEIIQRHASDPLKSVWVNASAGTGKTKVLTDRVLRLLLTGTEPEKILCLTFTKAAAAEMSNRLFDILIEWVSLPEDKLKEKLFQLVGEEPSQDTLIRARRLFAIILETKGGMKIMNFHSFCQGILRRFSLEAGVSPYFKIADDTESNLLFQQSSENINLEYMDQLSEFMDENSVSSNMKNLQKDNQKLQNIFNKYPNLDDLQPVLKKLLRLSRFDDFDAVQTELENMPFIEGDIEKNKYHYFTTSDTLRKDLLKDKSPEKETALHFEELYHKWLSFKTVKLTILLLKTAKSFFEEYQKQKNLRNILDYDDLILKVHTLLNRAEMSSWVLYKLDGGLDHILVDEAQDTSPNQWEIIRLLTEEFFAGYGQKDDKIRTLFVVGDRKQSIYSFQGADPEAFEKMRLVFKEKTSIDELPMNTSFRSTPPVLALVDHLLASPFARQGVLLSDETVIHTPFRSQDEGLVEIYPLDQNDKKQQEEAWGIEHQESEDSAGNRICRQIVDKIERMIHREYLSSAKRLIEPKDILVLMQRRTGPFVSNLVKLLQEKHIPIAGVDRLKLKNHQAIKDLISLGEFLLLPQDDLNLASLLKSPFFDVSEQELYRLCLHRNGSLFESIRVKNPDLYQQLVSLLNLQMPPFELYSYILGPLGGRVKIYRRLGIDAKEVLDEFLNLLLDFESPSLQEFLFYFKQTNIEIKRDLDQGDLNAVRIMTTHGSKGLQGNIVFLPDTRAGLLAERQGILFWENGLPIWMPRASLACPLTQKMKDELKASRMAENRRLLYVALTRARDRLYIYGFDKNKKSSNNWYDLIKGLFPSVENKTIRITNETLKRDVWYDLVDEESLPPIEETVSSEETKNVCIEPKWINEMPPEEKSSTQPLSPSHLEQEEKSESFVRQEAFLRGSYIHLLLQKLPSYDRDSWETVAEMLKPPSLSFDIPAFLEKLKSPVFDHLWQENSYSEVPISGMLDGQLISGQIDRLVIDKEKVLLIDYKTNHHPPEDKTLVPSLYKKQMSAYKGLLEQIFPDKEICSCLLWTETLNLMEI